MRHRLRSRFSLLLVLLGFFFVAGTSSLLVRPVDAAAAHQVDEDVPPGNPVIGSDRPGDVEPEQDSSFVLWGVVAVCLIGAGSLLVKLERWESRRVTEPMSSHE